MTSSLQNSDAVANSELDSKIIECQTLDSQEAELRNTQLEPAIALLPWGDLFEDHFDKLGVSFKTFRDEFTGSYQFGYVEALRLAGLRTVLFYFSARVSKTLRFTHASSGATVCILPASKIYLAVRKINRLPGIKTLTSYLATPLGLLAHELRLEGCQAILCQEYEYARFDICVLLGQLMGLPVFGTFQGGNKQLSRLEWPLRPLAIWASTGLIIATQTEIQRVRACYGVSPTKLARIFNPIDVNAWQAIDRSEARSALDIPINAQVVVWHGRVEIERKGLDILLKAWDRICCERPEQDLRLLLIGTGSNSDELRQKIIDMRLRGVLRVDEFVHERTAIRQYLSAADVYTLPSRHEGFPVAPIEAMACSLPIVAADAPGIPDILELGEESGGLVVPRGDATALALALGRVLDNEAWGRELGKRARRRVEDCFSLEAIGRQLSVFLIGQKALVSNSYD